MSDLTLKSTLKLKSGYELPQLGFGVYQVQTGDASPSVSAALDAGYRHVDSAVAYRNQGPCGASIRASSIPRSEIFYTSKVRPKDLSYESAKQQVADTLAETQLGYIDLMLLHSPYGGPDARKGAWRALVEAVAAGHVRSIGVSNYGVHHLDELEAHIAELEAERPGSGGVLSVGQWEVHPWCPRRDIVEWCAARGIAVEAYCPIVRGERFGEPVLRELAAKHARSEAQILLRWSLQKGYSPMPKSTSPERIRENAALYDFSLADEDMAKLELDVYAPCAWDPTKAKLED
ncbi:NADP-dependent oxidoreductase domain-containing protein [Xylariales sp. PMI_506]|nr:NADP-dependent oxidoreductase domain-containing protein [Xylariales sp. PMI_506]